MKKAKRMIIGLLIACLILSAGAVCAFAEDTLEIGAVYIYMPEIRVELKNIDVSTSISGQLDKEQLRLESFESYDPSLHSSRIFILADLSTSMKSSQSSMKSLMKRIVEHMGPNDAVTLVTFGATVAFVQEDCSDKNVLLTAVDEISCDEGGTLLCEAMQQVYQKAVSSYAPYDRQYVFAFSDFADYQLGSTTYNEAISNYSSRMLPLYGVYAAKTTQENADKFGELCRLSGGEFIALKESEDNAFSNQLDAMDDVAIAVFSASSNYADGTRRQLTVRAGSAQQNVLVPVAMSAEDTEAPEVISADYSATDCAISIVFSEPVKNADKTDAYELLGEDGSVLTPEKAVYYQDTCTVKLVVAPKKAGTYLLVFHDITDNSAQSNPLKETVEIHIQPLESGQAEPQEAPAENGFDWMWLLILALLLILVAVAVIVILTSGKNKDTPMGYAKGGTVKETIENQNVQAEVRRHIVSQSKVRLQLSVKTGRNEAIKIAQDITSSVIFGRSTTSDVCIDDGKLSRQHFAIEYQEGRLLLSDLNSTNGTMLNGIRIGSRKELHPGDVIFAGLSEVRVLRFE